MQDLQPNTTLQGGKYRIERVLGQGNFGITYLAEQLNPKRTVAIKELFLSVQGVNDRLGSSVIVPNIRNKQMFEQQITKFKKEAKRIMSLHNEHIVPVYDLFDENDTAYYVMEYVEGESLADKLKSASLSESTMEKYMSHILDALSAIHGKHLWHLDIKPANIMICDGNAVLIDFGASKHIDSNSTLTTSSAIAYTPGFAAPEQLDGDITKFGPWTDFYALGATMYQLLTLNRPPSFSEIFTKGKNAFVFSGISEKMQHLILWMMKPNRMERPQSVENIKVFCNKTKVLEEEVKQSVQETIYKQKKIKSNVDFSEDCLWPACFISLIIVFIYTFVAMFLGWPVFSKEGDLLAEGNVISGMCFIVPTIVLSLWFYDRGGI